MSVVFILLSSVGFGKLFYRSFESKPNIFVRVPLGRCATATIVSLIVSSKLRFLDTSPIIRAGYRLENYNTSTRTLTFEFKTLEIFKFSVNSLSILMYFFC